MASSGVIHSNSVRNKRLAFEWWTNSKDIHQNKTNIGYRIKTVGGSGYVYSGNFKAIVNGNTVYYSTTRIKAYNGTILQEGNIDIYHNENGEKSITIDIECAIYSNSVNSRGREEVHLDRISRKAFFLDCSDFTDESNPVIRIDNPGDLKIEVSLQFYGENYYFKRRDINKKEFYTIELNEQEKLKLYELMESRNSYRFNYVITTYSDNYSTAIGSQYISREIRIVNANPIFEGYNVEDINNVTNKIMNNTNAEEANIKYVKGNSILKIKNLSRIIPKKGARVKHYEYNIDGKTGIIDKEQTEFIIENAFLNSGNRILEVTAVDSRENKTTIQKQLNVIDYVNPDVFIEANRKNNFENDTRIKVNGQISMIGSNAIKELSYRYRKKDGDWNSWNNIEYIIENNGKFKIKPTIGKNEIWKNFDKRYEYEIEIKVQDKIVVNPTIKTIKVNKGEAFIMFNTSDKTILLNTVTIIPQNVISLSYTARQTGIRAEKDRESFFDFNEIITTKGTSAIEYNNDTKKIIVKKDGKLSISYNIKIWDIESFGESGGYDLRVYRRRGNDRKLINNMGNIMSRYDYKFPTISNHFIDVRENDEIEFVYSMGKSTNFTILGDWGTYITYNFME